MFWNEFKAGLYVCITGLFLCITFPPALGLGLYLMNKLVVPQIAPACEVRK